MKRILSTLALVAAIATSYGQTSLSVITTPGTGTLNNLPPVLLDGSPVTSVGDGYVVSFWWSLDDSPGSYVALGATYFNDASSNASMALRMGGFNFASPAAIPHSSDGETGYLAIRIFQFDLAGELGLEDPATAADWRGYFGTTGLGASSLTDTVTNDLITGWWEAAQTNSEYLYEDYAQYTTGEDGRIAPPGTHTMWHFGWNEPGTVINMTKNPDFIPEPSTWLLLGAGAAFTVIMRRRKK